MKKMKIFPIPRFLLRSPAVRFKSSRAVALGSYRDRELNVERALEYFDDFYGSVFGKKWPGIRIGLLSRPKFFAVLNTACGDVDGIEKRLLDIGAFDVRALWEQGSMQENIKWKEKREDELARLATIDENIVALGATKKASELELLYKNAEESSPPSGFFKKSSRLLSSVKDASNEFIGASQLKGMENFVLDSEYFESNVNNDDGGGRMDFVEFTKNPPPLNFPKLLRPFSFGLGSGENFPPARIDSSTGWREYLCVNGGSLATILALDLVPNVTLLDLCAGPGTKSLMALLTGCPTSITCNDVDRSRLRRVPKIITEFLGELPPQVRLVGLDGGNWKTHGFSRVLADVPCSNDRVSVTVDENNLFKGSRVKERAGLVRRQKEILLGAMSALGPAPATLVYSTCSLSPVENDGVVLEALRDSPERLLVDLEGLSRILRPLKRVMKIQRTRFGLLVTPSPVANFGPTFVARLVRA